MTSGAHLTALVNSYFTLTTKTSKVVPVPLKSFPRLSIKLVFFLVEGEDDVSKFAVLESAVLMTHCRARATWIVQCTNLAKN